MPRRTHRPEWFHGTVALCLTLAGTLAFLMLLSRPVTVYPLLGGWLVSINLIAFGYYGYDKQRARRGSRRVPELVLHGLAVAGGSGGAYAGMRFFHHKSIKDRFLIWFWLIVILQAALLAAVLYRLWTHSA
jgi:uncharacterized membrane protein YsdA (DUF1294 family)